MSYFCETIEWVGQHPHFTRMIEDDPIELYKIDRRRYHLILQLQETIKDDTIGFLETIKISIHTAQHAKYSFAGVMTPA